MALVCVPIRERTAGGMVRAARAARRRGADLVELRLDYLARCGPKDIESLAERLRSVPAVATLRPEREGGRYRGGERPRLDLLERAIRCGFEHVDLELSIGRRELCRLTGLARRRGVRAIVSHHDFRRTPPVAGIVQRLRQCVRAGGLAKAAFTVLRPGDCARILGAARRARGRAPGAIVVGMGPAGTITRTLSPFLGAAFVYAGLDRRRLTAPGQPDIGALMEYWKVAGGPGRVGASTGLYGILGHPLGHSLSPALQNAAFRGLGLDAAYLPFDVPPRALADTLGALRAAGLRGANVTIPHKTAVMELLDSLDGAAAGVGAVNTIVRSNGRLCGYNTDVAGFVGALEGRGVVLRGARALVVGAGGAARAAVHGLLMRGAAVTVVNRHRRRAEGLAGRLGGTGITVANLRDIGELAGRSDILVNCTPVGMRGFPAESPVPPRSLHRGMAVLDMVYNPVRTPLLGAARRRGALGIPGVEMFLGQAEESFRLWTGKRFPDAAARAVLCNSRFSTSRH